MHPRTPKASRSHCVCVFRQCLSRSGWPQTLEPPASGSLVARSLWVLLLGNTEISPQGPVRIASPPASYLAMGILPSTHALPPRPLSCCLGFQHPKPKAPTALRPLLLSRVSQRSGSTSATCFFTFAFIDILHIGRAYV